MKKYRLKKEIKEYLVQTLVITILFLTPVLVAICSLKNDFKKCDEITGKSCTIYDLNKVGR